MSSERARRDHFYFTPEEIRASAEAALKATQQRRSRQSTPTKSTPQNSEPPKPEIAPKPPDSEVDAETRLDHGMEAFVELVSAIHNAPLNILIRAKILMETLEEYLLNPDFSGVQQQVLENFYARPFMPELQPFIDSLSEAALDESRKGEKRRQKNFQVISAIKTLLELQEISRTRNK